MSNEKKMIVKLTNESCRDFFNNMVKLFEDKKTYILTLDLDHQGIPLNDLLEIEFDDIPDFLKHKPDNKEYIKLCNRPVFDKKKTITFLFVPDENESDFTKAIQYFEDTILKKYNKEFNKKYKVISDEFQLSPKVKEAFDEYIVGLRKGVNTSDRILFYRFILLCHKHQCKINETIFCNLLESEMIEDELIKDQCIRFFSCLEFLKFIKNKK